MMQRAMALVEPPAFGLRAMRSARLLFCPWGQMPARVAAASIIIDRTGRRDAATEFIDALARHQKARPNVHLLPGVITAQATLLCQDADGGLCPVARADHRAHKAFEKQVKINEKPRITDERRQHIVETMARLQLEPDRKLHRTIHDEYAGSRTYSEVRLAELHASKWVCRRCGALLTEGPNTTVHHATYGRAFSEVIGSDVQSRCKPCHDLHH